MNRSRFLLRLAAVASSVLLAGGFVAYSAGAFNWLLATSAPPGDTVMGGSKSRVMSTATASQPNTILPGSKSDRIILNLAVNDDGNPPNTKQPEQAIMGGSKSSFFLVPPKQPGAQPPPAQPPAPDKP